MTEILTALLSLAGLTGIPAVPALPVPVVASPSVALEAPQLGVPAVDGAVATLVTTLDGVGLPLGSIPGL